MGHIIYVFSTLWWQSAGSCALLLMLQFPGRCALQCEPRLPLQTSDLVTVGLQQVKFQVQS